MKTKPEILLAIGQRVAYLFQIIKGQKPEIPLLTEQEESVVKGEIIGLKWAAHIIEES